MSEYTNEIEFLQRIVLSQHDLPLPRALESLARTKQTHLCDPGCNWISLRPGEVYSHERRIATGDVRMCKTSSRVHICGNATKCSSWKVLSRNAGVVCTLTGEVLPDVIMSHGGKYDPHWVSVGGIQVGGYATYSEDIRSIKEAEKPEPIFFEEDAPVSEKPVKVSTKIVKSNETAFDKLVRAAKGNVDQVDRVLAANPGATHKELEAKVKTSVLIWDVAGKVYDTYILTDNLNKILIERANKAKKNFENQFAIYLRSDPPYDIFEVLSLWFLIAADEQRQYYVGGSLDALSSSIRYSVIKSMVTLWETYVQDIPPDRLEFSFKETCPSILMYMHEGFQFDVYEVPGEKRLYTYSELARIPHKRFTAIKHNINLITKHPKLILAPIELVRSQSNAKKRNKKQGRAGKNHADPYLQTTRKNHKKDNGRFVAIIPSKKGLQWIFSYLVSQSPTVEHFMKYCSANICPGYHSY